MTTRFPAWLRWLILLAVLNLLCACASPGGSAPVAAAIDTEDEGPLPPGVKPLTVEQEELVRDAAE